MPTTPTTSDDRDPRAHPAAGPAEPPLPPRTGPLGAVVAAARLPGDLLVALSYTVRQLPFLVQDVRSAVNDVALLARRADPDALGDVLEGLGRAAAPDGALTHALRAAGDVAAAHADDAATEDDRDA